MRRTAVGLGVFAILRLADINGQAADILNNWLPATRALGELSGKTERFRIAEANNVMARTPDERERLEKNMNDALAMRDKAWSAYEPLIAPGAERQLSGRFIREVRLSPSQQPDLAHLALGSGGGAQKE